MDTQQKWNTPEQEAYGACYAIKWNYYYQGSDIFVYKDSKPLQKLLNEKNANYKKE